MAGFQHFGIVGAGAWGTALAATLRRAGRDVMIWSHRAAGADDINRLHENRAHLPGVRLDPAIRATPDLAGLAVCDVLVFATPAQRLREIAHALATKGIAQKPLLIAAKGIETGSGKFMDAVAAEEMPGSDVAILSGPSFAEEVASGKPTALTLACANTALGEALAQAAATPNFRPYLCGDLIGAQLGGAIKNVLAIACGIAAGRDLGDNARAALITRGMAELMRLGAARGAKPETLMGLSGLGDLLLTCGSTQSRNMSLGIALAKGEKLDAILAARNSVAEGVPTAGAALALSQKLKVDMPIVAATAAVLSGQTGIDDAMAGLLARPLKTER